MNIMTNKKKKKMITVIDKRKLMVKKVDFNTKIRYNGEILQNKDLIKETGMYIHTVIINKNKDIILCMNKIKKKKV